MESEIAKAQEAGKELTNDWKYKKPGIPTDAYVNLFQSSDPDAKATDPIYVIPTDEELNIEMLYDVMTKDEKLAGLLSDNKTHGSAIENKISKETGVKIEAGKSYIIKIVVGLESVKFDVEVTPWQDADPKETDVDLPFNPGYAKVLADELETGAVYYLYDDPIDEDEFEVVTIFNKLFEEDNDADYKQYYYWGTEFQFRVKKTELEAAIDQNNAVAYEELVDGEWTAANGKKIFKTEKYDDGFPYKVEDKFNGLQITTSGAENPTQFTIKEITATDVIYKTTDNTNRYKCTKEQFLGGVAFNAVEIVAGTDTPRAYKHKITIE
jgi:hypothetical protein